MSVPVRIVRHRQVEPHLSSQRFTVVISAAIRVEWMRSPIEPFVLDVVDVHAVQEEIEGGIGPQKREIVEYLGPRVVEHHVTRPRVPTGLASRSDGTTGPFGSRTTLRPLPTCRTSASPEGHARPQCAIMKLKHVIFCDATHWSRSGRRQGWAVVALCLGMGAHRRLSATHSGHLCARR